MNTHNGSEIEYSKKYKLPTQWSVFYAFARVFVQAFLFMQAWNLLFASPLGFENITYIDSISILLFIVFIFRIPYTKHISNFVNSTMGNYSDAAIHHTNNILFLLYIGAATFMVAGLHTILDWVR